MLLKVYFLLTFGIGGYIGVLGVCTAGDQLAVAECGTLFSNGLIELTNGALSTSETCTQLDILYNTTKQCLSQYKLNCAQDQTFSQLTLMVDQGYAYSKDQLRCSGASSGQCNYQVAMSLCIIEFGKNVTDASNIMNSGGAITAEMIKTYCVAMQSVFDQTIQCLDKATAGEQACAVSLQLQKDVIAQTAAQLNQTCGNNAGACGSLALSTCMSGMGNVDSNNTTAICSVYSSAFTCIDDYKARCGSAEVEKIFPESQLKPLREMCSPAGTGDCGGLALSRCMVGMANMDPNNVTAICSVYNSAFKCIDDFKARCGSAVVDKMLMGTGPQLEVMKQMCSPDCADYIEKATQMGQCIESLPAVTTYTYNTICGHMEGLVKCSNAAMGTCAYLENLFKPQLPGLLQAISMYGCNITVGSHVYKPKGCSLHKMSSCYNPLLQAVGLPQLTADTNLTQFYTVLYNTNLTKPENTEQSCKLIKSSGLDLKAINKCKVDEMLKCPQGFLMPMESSYGKWRNKTATMPTPMPGVPATQFNLGDTLNRQELMASTQVFNILDETEKLIDLHCSGCMNATARIYGLFACGASQGITSADDISKLITLVISKFNNRQDFTAECSKLNVVANCTNQYMAGCKQTEAEVKLLIGGPNVYPAMQLCNSQLDFKLPDDILACDNPDFLKHYKKMCHQTCKPTQITDQDKLWGMTNQDVCKIIQEQVMCYTENAHCCQTKKEVLEPMMHTWGMLNKLLGCQSLSIQPYPGAPGLSIQPIDPSCDYHEVLQCYRPILKKVGIDTSSLTSISPQIFMQMFQLKNMMLQDPTLCVPMDEFSKLETCVKELTKNCKYPSTCGKSMMNTTPKMDPLQDLPLADILDLMAVKSICSKECQSTTFTNTTYSDCHTDTFVDKSGNVAWNDLTGADNTQYCSAIKNVSKCIVPKLGQCKYREMELHRKLSLDTVLSQEASSKCGVSFSPSTQTAPPPTITTLGPTTGAEHSKPVAFLILVITAVAKLLVY